MSGASSDERNFDISQMDREKCRDSSFWKRYIDKEENSGERAIKEEGKTENTIERMSPLEMESASLLDWTFEEQFKQLYELDDDPERKTFLDDYFEFMKKRGTPVNRIPIMAKQILDLYQLYRLVVQHGGLVQVIRNKQWSKITRGLNLPASITSAAFTLRTQYLKYLYTYECVMHGFSTPKELQAAIDNNKRDRFSTFYPSQPTMTMNNDGRYSLGASSSTFSSIHRPTPTHSIYRGMPLTMKRRMEVLDNRMLEKSVDGPKVVILRNGSPMLVSSEAIPAASPSGQRQLHSHFDSRRGRSPLMHESECKRPYQGMYNRGEWDGDIRQMIQGEHKENYVRERKSMPFNSLENQHNSKYPYPEMRDVRSGKIPCPCSYCLSDPPGRSQSGSLSMEMRASPVTEDSHSSHASPSNHVDSKRSSVSGDSPTAMEEKMEKDSSGSSSGFEELSPNAQTLSEDRRGRKSTDINMKITNDVTSPDAVIKISLEINGVVFRGSLQSEVKVEESEPKNQ